MLFLPCLFDCSPRYRGYGFYKAVLMPTALLFTPRRPGQTPSFLPVNHYPLDRRLLA
jgi:hypothetical protein